MLVNEEPLDCFSPIERFQMQAVGIEKGKPFTPDDETKAFLEEAGRLGGAMARANTYGLVPEDPYYYPGRKWQGFPDAMPWNFLLGGIPQIDVQNNVYYMAIDRQHARHGREERRPRLAIFVDLPKLRRKLFGWR